MDTEAEGLCIQCLFVVNATIDHRMDNPQVIDGATWAELNQAGIRPFCSVLDPRQVITWHEIIMERSAGEAKFTLAGMSDTLTGFGIYAGTLLCVGHLWQTADKLSRR